MKWKGKTRAGPGSIRDCPAAPGPVVDAGGPEFAHVVGCAQRGVTRRYQKMTEIDEAGGGTDLAHRHERGIGAYTRIFDLPGKDVPAAPVKP